MAYLHDDLLDAPLEDIIAQVENLYITSQEPTTYTEASSTYALGVKASPSITAPEDADSDGRKATVEETTNGSVTDDGTATHWALTDDSASKLLATGALENVVVVGSGGPFYLSEFDIIFPDAV